VITNDVIREMKLIEGFNNDWDLTYAIVKGKKKALIDDEKKSEDYGYAKDIFQEFYLGSNLFEKIYKKPSNFGNLTGFMKNEKLLAKKSTLDKLLNFKLGVATSRPRFEALFALRSLIPKYFSESKIVAQEDCKLEKPDPVPLLLAKSKIGCDYAVYVGDSYNDVLAAKRAKMPCIYVGDGDFGDFKVKNVNDIVALEVLK
jgi:HAD superfamily hydrolase (TIGR01549 family)